MANKEFHRMDKLLGPPPAPLVEHEHADKQKHTFFSRWKKKAPIVIHGPAGGYPAETFSPSERKDYEQLKKHQLELAHKEDELSQMELDLKKYEKELKERFDSSTNVDKARKEHTELSKHLELLTKQVQEKERMIRDLDGEFMLVSQQSKSKEKDLTSHEKKFKKAIEEFTKQKCAFDEDVVRFRQEKQHIQHVDDDLLKQKEALLHEKLTLEGDIAALQKRRAQLIEKTKTDVSTHEQHQQKKAESAIRGLTAERDRLLSLVKKLKPQVDELRALATPEFYNLSKREKNIRMREQNAGLADVRIKKMEDEVKHREYELGQKASLLAQEEKELDEQQHALKERMGRENQRVAMMLAEKEALLKNKFKILEQQIDRREHTLGQAEKNYNKEKGRMYLEFEKEREKLAAAIEEERNRLFGNLQQQKDHLSKDLVELETKKRELEHHLLEKKETITDLGETERLLNEKEQHLLNRINMLEVDEHKLHKREDEIIGKIRELEHDKKLLDEKENELIDVLKKLDLRENELRGLDRSQNEKNRQLAEREKEVSRKLREAEEKLETIKTNTSLKQKTGELENTAVRIVGEIEQLAKKKESIIKIGDLRREIETLGQSKQLIAAELEKERTALEQEINKLVAKVADMEHVFVADERLKQRQEFVNKKEEALEQEHERIQEQLTQLEDNSTRAVATMSLAAQQRTVTKEIFEADSREKVEIYTMMEQARDAIIAGNYDLAKQIYVAIQEAYKTFNLAEEDRRKIYFEVIELKTDIELGALC